jgi:hypothetical protein
MVVELLTLPDDCMLYDGSAKYNYGLWSPRKEEQ